MKLLTEDQNIPNNVMEEIELFKNIESPTGERIKLFLDELDLESVPSCDDPPLDLPVQSLDLPVPPLDLPVTRCVSPGIDFDLDLEEH